MTESPRKKHVLKRFLPYLLKYKWIMVFDLFCASLTTICDIVLPRMVRYLTDSATDSSIVLTVEGVVRLTLIYIALRLIDGAANFYMASTGHIMGVKIETDMRRDAFHHLQRLSSTFYSNTKVGTIMGRITNDLFDVTEFAHHCPEEFFIAAIKLTVSFAILCGTSVILTVIIFGCVPIMVVLSFYLNRKLGAVRYAQRVKVGELNATLEDSLLGQHVIKAFAVEDKEEERFDRDNQEMKKIQKINYYAMATLNTSTRLFDGLMYTVVILFGGIFLVKERISAGDLVAYVMYVGTLIATIRTIVNYLEQFQRGVTGIERFLEIMDTPVDIEDKPDAKDISVSKGGVEFRHVSFE